MNIADVADLCGQGHSLTDRKNVRIDPNSGTRRCRACEAERSREYRARKSGRSNAYRTDPFDRPERENLDRILSRYI